MLFANKQNLETELKVSLLSIRERELALYTNNCRNIASCSAILFGFGLTALMYESEDSFRSYSSVSGFLYEAINYLTVMLNTAAMWLATLCAMLGPGLALRGGEPLLFDESCILRRARTQVRIAITCLLQSVMPARRS